MDATVKVWDPATGKLLQTLEGPGESLDVRFLKRLISKYRSVVRGIHVVLCSWQEVEMALHGCGTERREP